MKESDIGNEMRKKQGNGLYVNCSLNHPNLERPRGEADKAGGEAGIRRFGLPKCTSTPGHHVPLFKEVHDNVEI